MDSNLILVHGLFACNNAIAPNNAARAEAIAEHGETIDVCSYEWVKGRGKRLANSMLRLARGTARAVDAVEIIELDKTTVRASLADKSTRVRWQKMLSCEPYGLDAERSFFLMGTPRQLLEGSASGQRLLWFGRGPAQLTEPEFIQHYTGHHGPLVAKYAQALGLLQYRQVPSEQAALCESLRELGLGKAIAPAVFAKIVMSTPPLNFDSLRVRRIANQEINADEKRHIDFRHSMLLLVSTKPRPLAGFSA